MPTYAPVHASGSTSGRMIKVVATGTPGTLLHTAVAGATDFDEIVVSAVNSDTVPRLLTVELGGVTSPDDLVQMSIPAQNGLNIVVPKGACRLNGAVVVRAFAAAANVVMCLVSVDRRTA
jgi:hypothetical protein